MERYTLSSCLPFFYCFIANDEGCIIGNAIDKTCSESAKGNQPIKDSFVF